MAHHHPPSTPDTVRGAFDTLSREEARRPCSLAAGLRATRTVDVNKGIHVMLEKTLPDIQQGQGT